MNILAPFNNEKYISLMTESGVGEFYMGFSDETWQKEYGKYSDINRLTMFNDGANKYGINDVGNIASKIHSVGKKIFITLNAPGYLRTQMSRIEEFLERLFSCKIDGVIAGVYDIVPLIRKHGLDPVASTMCGITNTDIAKAYIDSGVSRIIFPREMTLTEMYDIMCKLPEVEYEAFIMRNGCRYNDANCLGIHGGECGGICNSVKCGGISLPGENINNINRSWNHVELSNMHDHINRFYHKYACGQCALWDLYNMGIAAVKIVGRMDSAEDIAGDAALTRDNIALAAACSTREEFLDKVRRPGGDEYCLGGLSCYYKM